jgi:tRNA (cmo5U34)-methyltransferase
MNGEKMGDFKESSWNNEEFSENYLGKADIYIVERRKMLSMISAFYMHFFKGRPIVCVLDLGCGDGVITEELLKMDNSITATLVDGSQAMLKGAHERLKAYHNARFIEATFQEILQGNVELGIFDLCVSSLAIHHLNMENKALLFRYLFNHLKNGGFFLNLDVVLAPSEELEGWYCAQWKHWMQHMLDQFGVHDEDPDEIINRYKDPASMNKPDTLEAQLTALKETGFRDVDCYYKNGIFTIFGGRKA